jgi:hypothetical protein
MKAADNLTAAVGLLMLVQSALGLLFRSEYRDVEWIAATWLGNDLVTLFVAVPILSAALVRSRLGSPRALLLCLGLLAYAFYNYAYYLLGAALNAFFPIYIAAVVAAALALIRGASSISPARIARCFSDRTPVRLIGGYYVFVGVSLAGVWLTMWAAYAFAGRPTPIDTEAFKLVAALDTVLMVPALVIGGILLWRQSAWGYVVAPVAGVQGALYLFVLSVNSIIAVARGLAEGAGEIPMWGTLAVMTTAATVLLFGHAGERAV